MAASTLTMNWLVKTKPWSTWSNAVRDQQANHYLVKLRKNLTLQNQQQVHHQVSVAMRAVKIISISNLGKSTFLCWAERIAIYLNSFPGETTIPVDTGRKLNVHKTFRTFRRSFS